MEIKKLIALLLAAAMLAILGGCSLLQKDTGDEPEELPEETQDNSSALEYPVTVGRATLESRPGIVVSLSPSLTEKLYDLGLEDRLEGISDYCDEPDGFGRPRLGTVLTPELDELRRISPHLLLADVEPDAKHMDELEDMGVTVAIIPRAVTLNDLKDNYMNIARLMEGERTGGAMGTVFNRNLGQRLDAIKADPAGSPKNALYLRLLDFTVATGDTLENELLSLLGLNNIAQYYTGWEYPEEDANGGGRADFEALDVIFCDSRSVTIKMLENSEFYKGLNAVLKDHYLYIDSDAFERQALGMVNELERMREYIDDGGLDREGSQQDEVDQEENVEDSAAE